MRIPAYGALLLATLMGVQSLPAIAADVGGNVGSSDAADDEGAAAPVAAPPPELTVPDLTDRAFGEEEVPTADAMATLNRSSSGTVTETPPSAALAAILAQGLPEDDSAARSGPADVAAAAGNGLTSVKKSTVFPYRAVGQVYVTYGKNTYVCTGTLIGPSTVLTMALCLYGLEGNPAWTDKVEFYPGVHKNKAPYEAIAWDTAMIMKGLTDLTRTNSGAGILPYAAGLVILASPAGKKLGWFGLQTEPNETYDAAAITYGSGDAQGTMSSGTCTVAAEQMWRSYALPSPCPAEGWGNPLYVTDDETKGTYLTGMNVWKLESGATAETRLNTVIYQWLVDNTK